MSWVNLDDVYVNKTGDTIAGDLSVGGELIEQLLVGHEAALAVGDRDGEHVADV